MKTAPEDGEKSTGSPKKSTGDAESAESTESAESADEEPPAKEK